MIKNISQPLFQDYTWQGRLIGIAIRIVRIILGCFLFGFIGILTAFAYLLWAIFPLLCVIGIFGSFFGMSFGEIL